MKEFEILEEGKNDKVLVKWNRETRTNIESKEPKMANIQAQEGNKQEQIVSKTEQIGTDENKSEYSVHTWNLDKTELIWGHYFDDINDAKKYFEKTQNR